MVHHVNSTIMTCMHNLDEPVFDASQKWEPPPPPPKEEKKEEKKEKDGEMEKEGKEGDSKERDSEKESDSQKESEREKKEKGDTSEDCTKDGEDGENSSDGEKKTKCQAVTQGDSDSEKKHGEIEDIQVYINPVGDPAEQNDFSTIGTVRSISTGVLSTEKDKGQSEKPKLEEDTEDSEPEYSLVPNGAEPGLGGESGDNDSDSSSDSSSDSGSDSGSDSSSDSKIPKEGESETADSGKKTSKPKKPRRDIPRHLKLPSLCPCGIEVVEEINEPEDYEGEEFW
jgi:clumping factor A